MTRTATNPDRVWRAEARSTIALAWPLIATNLAQAVIHATDILLLGWLGAAYLAAGVLGSNLQLIGTVIALGVVTAAAPLIAIERGRRPHSIRDVRRSVRQALWVGLTLIAPIWLLLWHTEALLLLLGQEPNLATMAQPFVRAMMWGMLPFIFYAVLRNFVAALERPIWSLLIAAAGVAINAALNYCLVFGKAGLPALGIVGAGIGSSIANLMMFLLMALVVTLHPRFRRYHLFGRFWVTDWSRYRQIWRIGIPIGLAYGMEVTVFSGAAFVIGLINEAELAAHGIAMQVATISFMVPMGLAQAATVRVGLAQGRADPVGVARAGWTALGITLGCMLVPILLMTGFPRLLISAFIDVADPANQAVADTAVTFLALAALFQLVDGAQVVAAGMLRGLQDTTVPMLFAGLGYWVFGLPVGAWLAFALGWRGAGIWSGLALGLAIVAVLMLVRWANRERLGLVARG